MASRTSRTFVICFLILIVLTIAGLSGWRYAYRHSRATVLAERTSFEQDIGRNLPLGSEASAVQKFLRSRNMVFTDLAPPLTKDGWYQNATNTLEARTRDFETTLYDCSMHVELKFDATERLAGFRDKASCTGKYF